MMVTTLVSLWRLLVDKYIPGGKYPLMAADILLMLLAAGVIFLALRQWKSLRLNRPR